MKTTIASSLRKELLHISARKALILTAIVGFVCVPRLGYADISTAKTNLLVKTFKPRIDGLYIRPLPTFTRGAVRAARLSQGTQLIGYGVVLVNQEGEQRFLTAACNLPIDRPPLVYSFTVQGESRVQTINRAVESMVRLGAGLEMPDGIAVLLPGAAAEIGGCKQLYSLNDVQREFRPARLTSVRTGEEIESHVVAEKLQMTVRIMKGPAGFAVGDGLLDDEGQLFIVISRGKMRSKDGIEDVIFAMQWKGPLP